MLLFKFLYVIHLINNIYGEKPGKENLKMGIRLSFREKDQDYPVLEFEDFRKEVIADLADICGLEFRVEERDVTKNNGVMLHGISISESDGNVSPTIYLEGLYEEYKKGCINLREAENEILRIYSREKSCKGLNMCFITDFELIRDKIIFRLVNAERNEELLKEVPHRRFLDLAVIYTVFIDGIFKSPGNIVIRNDQMETWATDEKELNRLSLENTPRLKKPVIRELSDMIFDLMGSDDFEKDCMREELTDAGAVKMFVVTNNDKFYGDSIILYPDILNEIRENTRSDFYLLPSSVHEFIVVPDDGIVDEEELKELVRSVNETSVGEEDYLSDNVYRYSDSELSICC